MSAPSTAASRFATQVLNLELGRVKHALQAALGAFLLGEITAAEHTERCRDALERYTAAVDRPVVLDGLAEAARLQAGGV